MSICIAHSETGNHSSYRIETTKLIYYFVFLNSGIALVQMHQISCSCCEKAFMYMSIILCQDQSIKYLWKK